MVHGCVCRAASRGHENWTACSRILERQVADFGWRGDHGFWGLLSPSGAQLRGGVLLVVGASLPCGRGVAGLLGTGGLVRSGRHGLRHHSAQAVNAEVAKQQQFAENQMDTNKGARLTPKGREAMVRCVVDSDLSLPGAQARRFAGMPLDEQEFHRLD
jgi:hypothetical protein